jgi:hypothetical protein
MRQITCTLSIAEKDELNSGPHKIAPLDTPLSDSLIALSSAAADKLNVEQGDYVVLHALLDSMQSAYKHKLKQEIEYERARHKRWVQAQQGGSP